MKKDELIRLFSYVVPGGAMFCEHAKPRVGVAKFPSDGEEILVTTKI